jgi:ribosomal protein S18 acetylase RimI-like enzyme
MHQVRIATVEDAEGFAKVHIDTWRECYKGIVPDAYLESLDLPQRTKGWKYILSSTDQLCSVVESHQTVIGWVTCGVNRDRNESDIYEIYGIYVLPQYWGSDAGESLFRAAIERLDDLKPRSITLWVLKENVRAQCFYKKHGFSTDGAKKVIDIGGKELEEVRYELVRP